MSNIISSMNSTSSYPVTNTGLNKDNYNLQKNLEKSKQVVSDNVENNSIGKMFMGDSKPNEVALVMVPLIIFDNIFDKLMSSKLLDKAAKIGDKISNSLNLEKIFSKDKMDKFSKFIKTNSFTKYFTNDYKAIPKSAFAKHSAFSEQFKSQIISGLTDINNSPEVTNILNKSSDITKKVFESISNGNTSKISSEELIHTIEDLAKNNNITKLNKKSLFGGNINLSHLSKKLQAAESKIGKTTLGQKSAKGLLKTKDVLTYGGGMLSMLFVATGLINSYKEAKKAPKGEKFSTFMHVLSEQYLGLILIGPSTNLLYKVAGNKYRGMSVEGREALKQLISKANSNPNLTKEGLKIANIQKKLLLKGVDKTKVEELANKGLKEVKEAAKSLSKEGTKLKFWEKPLKWAGNVLATGLDTIKKKKVIKLPNNHNIKFSLPTLKGFAGGFARFMLVLMVLQPLLQKPITKLFHKIFGKPKTYLENQKKKEEETKSEPAISQSIQNENQNTPIDQTNNKNTNLLNQHLNQPNNNQSNPFNNDNNTAAQTPLNQGNSNEPIASKKIKSADGLYVPSIDPVVVPDNSAEIEKMAEELLKRTDSIIESSKKFLN